MPVIASITIDNAVLPIDDPVATHEADNNLIKVKFGRKSDDLSYVAVGTDDDHYIALGLRNSGGSTKEISGSQCVFHVKPYMDIVFEVIENRLKESIILSSRPPQDSLTFDYDFNGVTVEVVGGLAYCYDADENNELLFSMERPSAVDADGNEQNVSVAIDKQAKTITLSVDGTWLDNAVYPVTIDPTVATTTESEAIWATTKRYCHYANGYYWVAFYDGSDAIFYSAPANTPSIWTSQGNLGTAAVSLTRSFGCRFVGNTVHCAYATSAVSVRYRQGALNNDGTITWGTESVVDSSGNRTGTTSGGVDSSGYPWVASGPAANRKQYLNDQTDGQGTWSEYNQYPDSSAAFTGYVILQAAFLRNIVFITDNATAYDIEEKTYTQLSDTWDASWTDVATDFDTGSFRYRKWGWARTSDEEIHVVVIDAGGRLDHYKRATNGVWSTVASDITGATTHTAVTLGADGNRLYLFYDKGGSVIYCRQYDGSWLSEFIVKGSATALVGAFSCYEGIQNNEIGVVWTEGASSPYDVVFFFIQQQTATFTIDSYIAVRNTATFTIDAIIQATETQTFTLDAIIQATEVSAFTADAIIQATQTQAFTIDAIIQATETQAFTLDAIIQTTETSAFTIDAIIQATETQALTLDAIIQATQTQTFTLDAIIQATETQAFTLDAIIQATQTQTFTLDAIIQATQTQAFTLDAIIQATETAGFTCDIHIAVQATQTFTIDTIIISGISYAEIMSGFLPTLYYRGRINRR